MFARDGAFSQCVTFDSERKPTARVAGRWVIEGDLVKITLPSTAPVGVSPRQDSIVRWRIEKLGSDELTLSENNRKQSWLFLKKKSRKSPTSHHSQLGAKPLRG